MMIPTYRTVQRRRRYASIASDYPYDISPFAGLFAQRGFTPSAPVPATTSGTINVTAGSIASLQAAVATPNRIVNVPAGTYTGNLTDIANHVRIVMAAGARIAGNIVDGNFTNFELIGGELEGSFDITDVSDVKLDNLHVYFPSALDGIQINGTIRRMWIVRTTAEPLAGAVTNSWSVHVPNSVVPDIEHLVLARCKLDGGGGTAGGAFRLGANPADSIRYLAILDCLTNLDENTDGMRWSGVGLSLLANNINVRGIHASGTGGTPQSAIGMLIDGLYHYDNNNLLVNVGAAAWSDSSVQNSKIYNSATPGVFNAGYTNGGGNTTHPWSGDVADINYADVGFTGPSDFGADH
jgi:hypothetical protein